MIQIQLRPEIEARLAAEARDSGLALDAYIERLVSSRPAAATKQRPVGDAIDRIRELRRGNRLDGLRIQDLIHEGRRY